MEVVQSVEECNGNLPLVRLVAQANSRRFGPMDSLRKSCHVISLERYWSCIFNCSERKGWQMIRPRIRMFRS